MASHCCPRLVLIICMILLYLAALAFNALWIVSPYIDTKGLFIPDLSATQGSVDLGIQPPPFVFFITWGTIYIWQILWMLHLLTTLCRTRDDEYLYTTDVWPPAIFIMFMLNNAAGITWVFMNNHKVSKLFEWAPILVMAVTLYVGLALSAMRLTANSAKMVQQGLKGDIWVIRLFLHNGFGVYAAWTSMATLIALCEGLTVWGKLESDVIVTAIYSILLVEVLFWFFVDVTFLDKWTRYLFTPYFVFTFVLASIVYTKHDMTKRNDIFHVVLLGLAGLFLIVKMVALFWRHCNRPLLESDDTKMKSSDMS